MKASTRELVAELGVDGEAAAAHVSRCEAEGARTEHELDLVLAFAAHDGNERAVRRIERNVAGDLANAARRVDRDGAFVADVAQAVLVKLFVGDGDGGGRIGGYRGRGSLRAWVRVIATRVALNEKRAAKRRDGAAEVLEDLVAVEPDPELRHLKGLYRADFRRALQDALESLSDRQRALLRLSYVDGLRLADIGHLYAVHESTVSRWVRAALEAVSDGARRRLVERLSFSPSEVDSVARMVRSGLDLSIARLLGK